jgi:hypothetical protein
MLTCAADLTEVLDRVTAATAETVKRWRDSRAATTTITGGRAQMSGLEIKSLESLEETRPFAADVG